MADELLESFEAFARELDAMGCTEAEIDRIEGDQGVPLPHSYRCFLATMGRDVGGLCRGSDIGFPAIVGLRPDPDDPPGFPADGALLMSHQGYQFCFVRAAEGDDPPVYLVDDGENQQSPRRVADSILTFLMADRQQYHGGAIEAERSRRSAAAVRRLRFDREGCPRCGGEMAWRGEQRWAPKERTQGRDRIVAHCPACDRTYSRWADTPHARLRRYRRQR